MSGPPPGGVRRLLAWGVHAYTASGLALAAWAAALIVRGAPEDLHTALAVLAAATAIDGTDGFLARAAHVKTVLPGFDGRRLDDIIDFQTYTSLPLLLVWRADLLPGAWAAFLLLPLLASAYGFSQVDAKTDDGYFLGFPSYWNVVALYLFFLRPPVGLTLAVLGVLALLTFVPSRWLYPSQPGLLNRLAIPLAGVWAALLAAVLLRVPADPRPWVLASLFFPAYYVGASWVVTLRRMRRRGGALVP